MPRSTKSASKPSVSRSARSRPIPLTRIQTAEGWKRSLIRKRQSSKTSSKR